MQSVPRLQVPDSVCPAVPRFYNPRSTGEIERDIGQRIAARRVALGLTQQQLAEAVGVSFQQIHKYERGINRVSAARLWQIADALRAPVTHFFEPCAAAPLSGGERCRLELARAVEGLDQSDIGVLSMVAQRMRARKP